MLEVKGHRTDHELLVARAVVCENMTVSMREAQDIAGEIMRSLPHELSVKMSTVMEYSVLAGASVALQWACCSEHAQTMSQMISEYIAEHGEPDLTKD